MRRVVVVEGLYNESLTTAVKKHHALTKAAVVHIDCDHYLSTKDVLSYIESVIHPGTILIFDDWHDLDEYFGVEEAKNFGEQRAFNEWALPDRFAEFYHSGIQKAFILD